LSAKYYLIVKKPRLAWYFPIFGHVIILSLILRKKSSLLSKAFDFPTKKLKQEQPLLCLKHHTFDFVSFQKDLPKREYTYN